MAENLQKDSVKLRAIMAQERALPELIDAEMIHLVDSGYTQAELARLLDVTPQEVSRRIIRGRAAKADA